MYLVGAPHPHNADALRLLESAIAAGKRLVTDVEVLQEILHRYAATGRREAMLGMLALSARDAVHAAVMVPGLTRFGA